jgi:triacylglycerol lipase
VKQVKSLYEKISSLLGSLSATSRCLLLYPFKTKRLDLSKDSLEREPGFLCVHGYLHNNSAWGYLKKRLKAARSGPVNTIAYPTIVQDIPQNSLLVKGKIEEIKRVTGRDVKVLIGHSLGGLICLEYALEHAPKDQMLYVITLASPLHGTAIARYAPGRCCRQMEVNSSYIQHLHERLSKAQHLRVCALASRHDRVISPTESALLKEYPFAQTIEFDRLGHVAFLFSPRVTEAIISYLRSEGVLPLP